MTQKINKSLKNLKRKNNIKNAKKNNKQSGSGKLALRCMNMDCGPPFHPMWKTQSQQNGGKNRKRNKFSQRGGSGQGNQGHDVSMPIRNRSPHIA